MQYNFSWGLCEQNGILSLPCHTGRNHIVGRLFIQRCKEALKEISGKVWGRQSQLGLRTGLQRGNHGPNQERPALLANSLDGQWSIHHLEQYLIASCIWSFQSIGTCNPFFVFDRCWQINQFYYSVCVHTHTHTHKYTHVHTHTHTHTHTRTQIHKHAYTHNYTHVHTHTNTHTSIYTQLSLCLHLIHRFGSQSVMYVCTYFLSLISLRGTLLLQLSEAISRNRM